MTPNETPTPPGRTRLEIVRDISTALVERRKARGLSLDKVQQILKIRMNFIQAMEKGEWDQLPGEVYVRGFLRRYAQFLGLDADRLIEPYILISQAPVEGIDKAPTPLRVADRTPALWIWVGLATFLLIAIINLARYERSKLEAALTPPVEIASAPEPEPAPAPAPAAPKPEPHRLEIFSPFPLWLRVEAEDRMFEGFIPSESSWTWKGQGVFSIRLGHTRQVALAFDGQAVPLVENQKRVRLPLEN